ncbi:hypothetical protein PPL_12466 [Heterostelium album PN500]|uniref:Uncharacterized protein n=1 Tax=Heterostelium pallidum (strain ATCC 26659 / Pp 5 / PN500) TaxID=670386 RepID=D3BMP3_HETP5|nr:hypothetical protein PPL_12466 [Heterostelium album PN500]EFA77255.1 hypothetical protein PPL_12466 [Heterostelium album PN500]|eukprot:XP_020429384.1 hypothetical protein PPL_12466 [Heterostelium album PN500]
MTESYSIISTFQSWRLAKTKQEHPEFDSIDINTLTAENFLALSTFDRDTQVDIVQDKAEQFFIDLVLYHLSSEGLNALGSSKPSLNADLLELVQDPAVVTYFQNYAPLWLLQTIYHHDQASYQSDIKGGVVENSMFSLNKSNIFILITMKLYYFALKQLVPAFLPFIYWSDLNQFQIKVRVYFKDTNVIKNWMTTAIQCQNADIGNRLSFDAVRFNELKTKLDLLQPNNRLSNDIVGSLWYSLLSYYSTKNLINNPVNRNIVIATNQSILNRIIANPDNQFNTQINDATTALACDKPTLINLLSDLMIKAALETPFDNVVPGADFQSTAKPYTKEFIAKTPFTPLQDNSDFLRFANAIYCACHVGVLAYGILNGHDYTLLVFFNPGLMYIGEGLFIYKYADGIDQGNIFSVMGDFLRSLTNDMAKDATNIFTAFQTLVPRLIHPNTSEHITRLIPSFYILTKDQQAFQLFKSQSSMILDWGKLAVNLHKMDENEVDNCIPGLFTVFKKAGCAATSTALLLGNNLYGLSLCARVYPQLEMTLKRYELTIKGQFDISNIPDPIEVFINSVEEKFRIDYDGAQFDDDGWESYYESLDPRIQRGIDILKEVHKDNLNDMFVLLAEMEQRVREQEYNRFTTQIVKLENNINTVQGGDWKAIPGSQATVTITRPSRLIATLQFYSNVLNNGYGSDSIDVTSAINNQLMTLGGYNQYPWPVGTSISHSRDWSTGFSITEQILQVGVYQYDIRARIRGSLPSAQVDAPAAVLFIAPL